MLVWGISLFIAFQHKNAEKNTIYSILARGYLFHDADGNVLHVNPKCKIDLARRALLAWCSIPDSKKATPKEEWQ